MTTEVILRLAPYVLWSIGMVVVWGWLLLDDIRRFTSDQRDNLEDLLPDFGFFVAGVLAVVALVLIAAGVPDWRGFFVAMVFGAFLAAGIIKATLRQRVRRRRMVPKVRRR